MQYFIQNYLRDTRIDPDDPSVSLIHKHFGIKKNSKIPLSQRQQFELDVAYYLIKGLADDVESALEFAKCNSSIDYKQFFDVLSSRSSEGFGTYDEIVSDLDAFWMDL